MWNDRFFYPNIWVVLIWFSSIIAEKYEKVKQNAPYLIKNDEAYVTIK